MSYIILFLKDKTNTNLIIDSIKGLLGTNFELVEKEYIIIKYDKKEEFNLKEIANILVMDFSVNLTLLEVNSNNYDYVLNIVDIYNKLSINNTYYLCDKEVIKLSSKNDNEIIKKEILKCFYNDKEYLNIIKVYLECNLNTTMAASRLFLHRNTLINKIDKFINITNYDIRKFSDAYVIYQIIT